MVYNVEKISLKDEKRWNNLLFNSIYPYYFKSLAFIHSQKFNNRKISSFIFNKNGQDVAGINYFIKSSKWGFIRIADIMSGIILRNEPEPLILSIILEHFIEWAQSNNASYARIKPWLPFTLNGESTNFSSLMEKAIKSMNFKIIENGWHTYWIDLEQTEEELLSRMKPQTRRHIKKIERSSIEVEIKEVLTPDLIETFWNFYSQRGKEKKFETLKKDRFIYELTALMDTGLATLFILKCNNKLINISLTSNFGVGTYYHGALAPDYQESANCPSPGYAAQWAIIKYLRTKGVKIYDMAFCPGPVPIQDHPKFDIWRFKYGFGGKHVVFMPTYGKIIQPIKGKLFHYLKYRKK